MEITPGAIGFVICGQSNALGEAVLEPGDETPIAGVKVLRRDGREYESAEPLGGAGYGFGRTFAQAYLEARPDVPELWLLQCAVSGTTISQWRPNQEAYDVHRVVVHEAQALGITIKGILWHQGEADAKTFATANTYGAALSTLIGNLRTEIGEVVPFVAGEIGRFLPSITYPYRATVVRQTTAQMLPQNLCAFAGSSGLDDKGDNLHFNHAAQEELGRRYAAALVTLGG